MGQVAQQIAFADRILLNKIDLVDAQHLAQVERRIRFSSPNYELLTTTLVLLTTDAQHLAQVERRIRFSSPNYELLTTTLVLLTTDAQHLAQVERRIRFSSPEFCFPLRILYSLENTESLEIR